MQTTTILYLILALLLSFSVAFFQYYYKTKNNSKVSILLFVLKSLSLFLLLLLFINPTIHKTELQNTKPVLAVLVDNSKSIPFFNEEQQLRDFISKIKIDKELSEKFDLKEFRFGKKLTSLDSLSFADNETNISEAINSIHKLYKNTIAPVLLLTDGNQTIGADYEFINAKQVVYPIAFGDTTQYKDLKISQLNVNKYSYIKNKFPVEVLLNYEGKEKVRTQFSILKNGKTVFTKSVQFSSTERSKTINTNFTSSTEGLQFYKAILKEVDGEKNIKNNTKSFSVEVIDEQTKVLILASVLHPDLGAIKKSIESKQRKVDVFLVDNFKKQLTDYQLVILCQPTNNFNKVFEVIKTQNSHYFLISGTNTDWNFINTKALGFAKKAIRNSENYGAIFNRSFLTFLQKDIGFHQFPPLQDQFGEVVVSKESQTLLYQQINGLETTQPLLATFEQDDQKSGVLFGAGIWKWRAASYLNTNSFQEFDEFIGNLVQYLASNKKRNRLEVHAENLYPANSTIKIAAFYTDKNYKFDARASLEITITNTKTKKVSKLPFSLLNNSYQSEIENLDSGDYTYKVAVIGQDIHAFGKFKITEYQIEEQFTNANTAKLLKLANRSGGKLYFKDEFEKVKKVLLENKLFYTSQKSTIKEQELIDWKWILFAVISLLSIEWFVRKYYGKI
ncbi:VWA domain-containing protein [Polaribacter sp.]|uniref:VWA domain-containing protein n=1 Tax=Polaribacter sp. TaxID=1920175 RepID=UPI003EF951F1